MGIPSDGKGCPNEGGVFSGSAAVIKGMPTIVYPGVHNVAKDSAHPDGIGMAQCLARPANISDKYLRHWRSQIIVPTYPPPGDVNNHYHDDAQVWLSASDNRYYTFASGGNMRRTRGVNLLYSCAAQDFETRGGPWRYEHPLWNISDGSCNFVSCPEMYSLPGIPDGTPMQSGAVVVILAAAIVFLVRSLLRAFLVFLLRAVIIALQQFLRFFVPATPQTSIYYQ